MLVSPVLVIGFVAACSGHASLFLNPSEDLGDAIQPVDTKQPGDKQGNQRPSAVPQQNSEQQPQQTVPQQNTVVPQQQQQQPQYGPQPQFVPQKNNGYYPTLASQPFSNGYTQLVPGKYVPPPASAQPPPPDQKMQDVIAAMVAQQVAAYEGLKKNADVAPSPAYETGPSSFDVGAPAQVPAVYAAAIAAAAAAAAVQVMTYALPSIRTPAIRSNHNGVSQQYQYFSYPAKGGVRANGANGTPFSS